MFRIGRDGGVHFIHDSDEIRRLRREVNKKEREIREVVLSANPDVELALIAGRALEAQIKRKQYYEDKIDRIKDKSGLNTRKDVTAFFGDETWRNAWRDAEAKRREADDLLGKVVWDRENRLGKVLVGIRALGDAARSWVASGDESGIGIQCAWYMIQHPAKAIVGALRGLRAFFDEEYWKQKSEEFLSSPRAHVILEQMNVKVPLHSYGYGGGGSEEVFERGYVAKNIFKLFGGRINLGDNAWIRASERAFALPVMTFRLELANRYIDYLAALEGDEKKIKLADLKYAGRIVNAITGAGDFFGHGDIKSAASMFLWASGRGSGQLQTLAILATANRHVHKDVRDELLVKIRNEQVFTAVAKLAGIYTLLALMNKVFGDDDDDEPFICWDPRSSKFGKIKIGNRYVSITGNLEQYPRMLARLFMQTTVGRDGVERKYGEGINGVWDDDLWRSIKGKLRPEFGTLLAVANGKDVVGNKISRNPMHAFWDNGLLTFVAKNNLRPMTLGEISEAAAANGVPTTALLGMLAWIGISGTDYGETPYVRARGRVKQLDARLKEKDLSPAERRALLGDDFNANVRRHFHGLHKLEQKASAARKQADAASSLSERKKLLEQAESFEKQYVNIVFPE